MHPHDLSPIPNPLDLTDFRFFLRADAQVDCPNMAVEALLQRSDLPSIAGVDEAGRGPLAGPVVAAAIILRPGALPSSEVNDSKKIKETDRRRLFTEICEHAYVGIGIVSSTMIDQWNIRAASLQAMRRALISLPVSPDAALIDGNAVPKHLSCPSFAMIKGDARSTSIAAASIVAKVTRDNIMARLHKHYPAYGFAQHKGYPTQQHRDTLTAIGPCSAHRKSFAPVAASLAINGNRT